MRPLERLARRKAISIDWPNGRPSHDADGWFYPASSGWASGNREEIDDSFEGHVQSAYKRNGVIFACITARQLPYSEVRFQLQEIVDGRPGRLRNDPSLAILDEPWKNGTTGDLLARMEQDASLAGNFYATPVNGRLRRLRPDWVTIVSGVLDDDDASPWDLQADVLWYSYKVPGRNPVIITPDRMVHYAPIPDPEAQWRGMSWLTPVLREIRSDSLATTHKLRFFERGANLGVVIKYDPTISPTDFQQHVAQFEAQYAGASNAYKTLHIGGGADPQVMGVDLKQLDFKAVQGAGETRIAAAAGVGAVIAGFSEGLAGSALNAGNYGAAKRKFGDMTIRPLWRATCGALSKLVSEGPNERLWYDARDVQFLQEDAKDAADIQNKRAQTIRALTDAGYTPDSVIDAVEADDMNRLVHSGLYSVQLQPAATVGGDMPLDQKVEALGALIRAGFEPGAAATAVGLNPIAHTGLRPVTVTSEEA